MQSQAINLHITDETSELETVILGIGVSSGEPRGTNTKAREAIKNGTYPSEAELSSEVDAFEQALRQNGVKILRPVNIENLNQIFTRDLGFVVDDYFVFARLKLPVRQKEIEGIKEILSAIDENKIIYPPEGVYMEGGDVIQAGNFIFIGTGARTNRAAADFLQEIFPHKQVIPFEMVHGTNDEKKDIVHLDCAFQPVGQKQALLYEGGFVSYPQEIIDIFGKENIITVSADEMYQLFPNIFSISPSKIITCRNFTRLNKLLAARGFEIIEIPYHKVSILGGLLRCSTLPLTRKNG